MWGVVAIVFYALSTAFGGTGSLKRTLEFVGYGYLPQIFGNIVNAAIMYVYVSGVRLPTVTDPAMIAEVTAQLMRDPLVQIAGVVGILFFLWSANIWVFALRYARGLSARNAALTVGIPVALYVLYTAYTLFWGI